MISKHMLKALCFVEMKPLILLAKWIDIYQTKILQDFLDH